MNRLRNPQWPTALYGHGEVRISLYAYAPLIDQLLFEVIRVVMVRPHQSSPGPSIENVEVNCVICTYAYL